MQKIGFGTGLPGRWIVAVLLGSLVCTLTACALKPIPRADLSASKVDGVRAATAKFRSDDRLDKFFEDAQVFVVYPFSARAASGFGGAYGRGLVFDSDEKVIAHSRMVQFSVGPHIGGQVYRQIMFFRSREIYEAFTLSPADFAGQVNASLLIIGVSATPSFNTDVAMFTQLRGGLLLEASVGAHRYTFAPVEE